MAAGGYQGHRPSNQHITYLLELLPPEAKSKIADYLDGDFNRFSELAYHFGFGIPTETLWNRGFNGRRQSATLHLLDIIAEKGGTVQQLYTVFYQMNHSAVHIIREYLPDVQAEYRRRTQAHYGLDRGQQNSCSCPSCNGHQLLSQSNHHPSSGETPRSHDRQVTRPEQRWIYINQWEAPEPSHETYTANHVSNNSLNRPRRQSENNRDISISSENQRSAPVPNNQTNGPVRQTGQRVCTCEQCRLNSDANETQLLTCYPTQKGQECLLQGMEALSVSSDQQYNSHRDSADQEQSNGTIPKTHTGRVCAYSEHGCHYLGQRSDTCPTCRSFEESKELRHSWHGDKDLQPPTSVGDSRSSLSDSSLHIHNKSTEVIYNRLDGLHSVDVIQAPGVNNLNTPQNIAYSQSINNSEQTSNNTLHPSGESGNNNNDNINNNSVNNSVRHNRSDIQNNNNNSERITKETGHQSCNPPPRNPGPDPVAHDNEVVVFITYSPHSNGHLDELKKLIGLFRQAGIRVKVDMDPDCFHELGLNRNEWLDRSVDNARYVIVCISPTYHADVIEPQMRNAPSPRISQLNARYIFDRLRTEYINNQSENRRMIPVLFPNSGAEYSNHVPHLMQATLVYTFPTQVNDIIARILGLESSYPYV